MGPVSFNISINDLEDGAGCTGSKFGGDMELGQGVVLLNSAEGYREAGEMGGQEPREAQ